MADYQHLTADELLHLAEESERLTDEARLALDSELSQRRLSPADIDSYRLRRETADESDKLKRARPSYIHNVALGKRFFGKTNRLRDTENLVEQYDTTLWFRRSLVSGLSDRHLYRTQRPREMVRLHRCVRCSCD
jgi:hypothetical protein